MIIQVSGQSKHMTGQNTCHFYLSCTFGSIIARDFYLIRLDVFLFIPNGKKKPHSELKMTKHVYTCIDTVDPQISFHSLI